jgi:hypothetical protein
MVYVRDARIRTCVVRAVVPAAMIAAFVVALVVVPATATVRASLATIVRSPATAIRLCCQRC